MFRLIFHYKSWANVLKTPATRVSSSGSMQLRNVLARSSVKPKRIDYYDVLGVSKNATYLQIQNAYELMKAHHLGRIERGEATAEAFRPIEEAFRVLGNYHERWCYDRGAYAFEPANAPIVFMHCFLSGVGSHAQRKLSH